jgi:hypothetical protein
VQLKRNYYLEIKDFNVQKLKEQESVHMIGREDRAQQRHEHHTKCEDEKCDILWHFGGALLTISWSIILPSTHVQRPTGNRRRERGVC